ncbi:MAG: 50S ribosomal protein L6 [Dehalococcoidia bacterium]|nr:50S ribosomal protein L6 [Dehalococcoidia bacterium]
MSHIGSLPISIPQDVKVKIEGSEITVEGSKGKLARCFHPDISVTREDEKLLVTRPSDKRMHRELHGLTRSLLANMVEGVSKGFERILEINGVGYRTQKVGDKLSFQIGYSNMIEFSPPQGVEVSVEGTNIIHVTGIDKEIVGETAARIRAIRPPDHYKGKGIKYREEKLHLKPGKSAKTLGRK